jgi:hypothetical protein
MTEGSQTKVCPLCAETIKVVAKICPFCQTRQGRWVLLAQELFILAYAFVAMGFLIALGFWAFPEDERLEGRRFSSHRSELTVVRVALDRGKKRPQFWLSGFVTNTGTYPWRVHQMEVRFVDEQGRLFDVYHPTIEAPFVVEPGREHSFRAALGSITWTNAVALPQVRVQFASDGHLPPKD